MNRKPTLEDIVSLCKRRGFIYPSSEIYGGLAGVYDYGPLGVKLKHNIQNIWWSSFVSTWEDMYPMDAAILMNHKVWQASGHEKTFTDPLEDGSRFNTMFKTSLGAGEETAMTYLRPETAQGMFVNFKNILDSYQPDMPFGMAQIGKAFRNEISPRDFLFRLREMEQMEIEYFVYPDAWKDAFNEWKEGMATYFKKIGINGDLIHEKEVAEGERAHYSQRTVDFEFDFPFGTKELAGLAYRGDYDLKKHQEKSGVSMQYQPKDGGEPFTPHVVEPSFGVERTILALLCSAYTVEDLPAQTSSEVSAGEQGGEKRIYLKFPAEVAPVKVAVFPLLKNKPELVRKAREVYDMLSAEIIGVARTEKKSGEVMPGPRNSLNEVAWDDNGNIGKRYRRQDEIGTPVCVTIDFQTLEDDTVTLRSRDTTQQDRVKVGDLVSKI